ncbi:MAG: hypothetical protein OEY74_03930, partial [Gammaproteobacteria bacterium]|nr:hypothetical protein [Gammaproteobacteria bacterium]
MSVELREMINFHLTGKRANDVAGAPGADAVPALFVPYRKLTALRYDFPLVLVTGAETQAYVDTLTGVMNRLLRDIAPRGNAGAQLRQHVLRLERRMRELAADGRNVTLSDLWRQAENSLLAECDETAAEWFGNSIATARFALRIDGPVVDCDEHLPARLLEHAWTKLTKSRQVSAARINELSIRLRDMLKVDDLKNAASRTPQKLKSTLGKRYKDAFDFERMAEMLDDSTPHNRLPVARRNRITTALSVLESQKYFALPGKDEDLHTFVFDSLSAALKAYHTRLPEIAAVIRAIEIAELELDNAYQDDKHSAYFDRFGPQALSTEDLAMFPSYLVCLHEHECSTRDLARLMEIINGDLPMKVLIEVDDPLDEASFVRQLVHTFVAGNAYVMQSPASNLYRQRHQVQKGLEFAGPAIFSVFAPCSDNAAALPAYLLAAAAMESRAFPAFSYDPSAGEGLAVRFDIGCNPEVEADWPRRELRYEDEDLQALAEDAAFTPVDFAVTDPKYDDHFSIAPRNTWTEDLVAVAAYLEQTGADSVASVPYVPVVGSDNVLRRLIVDDKLIRIARRCRERWHSLQELGSVHNSYACAARADAVTEFARAEPAPEPAVQTAVPASEKAIPSEPEIADDPGAKSDEAYI